MKMVIFTALSQSDFLNIKGLKQNFKLTEGVEYSARGQAIYIYRGILYLADNFNGIVWIADISNPGRPVFLAKHYYEGEVFDLAVEDVIGDILALVMFTSEKALVYYIDDSDYSLIKTSEIQARKEIFAGLLDIGYVYLFDADLVGHMHYIQDT